MPAYHSLVKKAPETTETTALAIALAALGYLPLLDTKTPASEVTTLWWEDIETWLELIWELLLY